MNVYVVVSICGGDKNSKQKTKTPADHDGGANPTWGFPMKFTVEEVALQQNRLMLEFKLICERAFGDRDIGEVHVPIKELLDSPAKGGAGGMKFVSYQVRKPNGKPKGHLTFSYQFIGKITSAGDPLLVVPCSVNPPTAPMMEAERGGGYYPPRGGRYPPPPGYVYPLPPPGYWYRQPLPRYVYPPQLDYGYPPAEKNGLGWD
ncbi:hypothetical protein DH2020_020042 [Rehmannia glutinosa]|uniref:C2 domain-containing protein n=1 Tax=Rehmannia glutinosa TaxID=99300 RepID=A0ABR0WF77_REHGL